MASYWLKKVPLIKHSLEHPEATVMIGYGPDECDRVERLLENNEQGIKYDFPLRWKPRQWFCDVKQGLVDAGFSKFPKAYDEGMGHNNCNRQCIRGGIKYWMLLLKDDPDRYLYNEGREQDFLAMLRSEGRKEFTFLRDRRGGTTKNMSLLDLRKSVENGERFPNEKWRHLCACEINIPMPIFQIAR